MSAKRVSERRAAVLATLALPLGFDGAARAEVPAAAPRLIVGVSAHDQGPDSDRHEDGVDLNLEGWWAALPMRIPRLTGTLHPHLGLSLNTAGDTSFAYGGLTYLHRFDERFFVAVPLGLAVHDGPLETQDEQRCRRESDCGFGSRVLFSFGLELGVHLSEGYALSLFTHHVSHGGLLADDNEGIDNIGLRLHILF